MAVPRRRDPELEELIQQAAAEAKRLNPHLATPPQPFTEEEITEILRGDEELDALWNSPEGQQAQARGISAADIVSEDRGE
jgi:predicted DNA-binding transcriptional regulator YafY